MANTTKARVLLLAPELGVKVNNIAQQTLISIVTVANSTQYSVTINNVTYTITSAVSATALSIAAQFVTAITSAAVIVINNLNGTFTLIATSASATPTIVVSAGLAAVVTINAYLGDDLCTMILEDVALWVVEEIFGNEQERAQRYLVAHLLSLINIDPNAAGVAGDYVREVVGDVEYYKNAGDKDAEEQFYSQTTYGITFYEIYQRHFFRFL